MSEQLKVLLEKLKPFFKENVDYSKITKITEILTWPIESLKDFHEEWKEYFNTEMEMTTIKDLADFKEPLEIEGFDPDELNKVAMISEMIFWKVTHLAQKGDQKKKIIILGLDNAGKTSAIVTLSEKYSGIKSVLPTRGLIRQSMSVFGYEISTFDFGGQKDYRDQYFEKAEMHFANTDMIIFCIDVQDSARYDEALEYLGKVSGAFDKLKLYPPILVDFTKLDPDIANDEKINHDKIKLIERIDKLCEKHDIGYANSSIYDRNSIENVFSLALRRVSTSNAIIERLIKDFILESKTRACSVVSSSGLILGSYGATKQEEDLLNNSSAYLQNLYSFHLGQGLQREDYFTLEYKRNRMYFVAEYLCDTESGMIYIWVLTEDMRNEIENIGRLKENLEPLIKIFL